ncbi:alpha/beta fold hydrolase [Roseomonas hellenica]|uniref:Alpha/beta fold hydrolase n=1 Tax=Plastoroseomonas hellenica TaxID=2687306 RepID=A0ABS5F1M0_9PROT|nr:alpha/beta fold hydrolase [Plastoroseomonas hellenica]MBR0666015.1 alpha/beta fold hydrolase [Plastoroseomonas hellenica]
MIPRRGPRPLPLHLGLASLRAMLALTAPMPPPSSAASPSWNDAWPRSKAGRAEAARIAHALAAAGHKPEAFRAAVLRRLMTQDGGFLGGVLAYRRQDAAPAQPEMPVLWQDGGSRVLDYGGAGTPVLFVPSLVNRATVLDLSPERSMLRHLAGTGMRPLLLDWGWPGEQERRFALADYIARLDRALAALPGPLVLAGYCMGGLLALAAALRRPERLSGLALLATPWDFHAGEGQEGATVRSMAALAPLLDPWLDATGTLPVDVIQAMFAALDPFGIAAKYRAFARLAPGSSRARLFVALEDWLNDGVPLAAPVARECLGGWYGRNETMAGAWRVDGAPVLPGAWRKPAFLAIPARDRIVPPASARALAQAMPGARAHEAAAGHVGMVAGSGAEAALWRPLAEWVASL